MFNALAARCVWHCGVLLRLLLAAPLLVLVACCLLSVGGHGHAPCAAQQPNSLLLVASLLRGIAAESSLPIRTGEGAKG